MSPTRLATTLATVTAAFVVLAATGCELSSTARATTTQPKPAPASATLSTVATARPTLEMLSRKITLNGEFKPYQVADLHAKVSGYLKKITVDVGDRVREGQQIALLEVPETEAELAQAIAERN